MDNWAFFNAENGNEINRGWQGWEYQARLEAQRCANAYGFAVEFISEGKLRHASSDDDFEPEDGEIVEPQRMPRARNWAKDAEIGDYLIEYADSGFTDEEDSGSRCGFSDPELAEIESILRERDMTLQADDTGLVAAARES